MSSGNGNRAYAVVFLVAASAGIGVLSLHVLRPFLAAIAWAAVLAVVFHGPWTSLERRWPKRRNLSAALMTMAIALLVVLPAGLFAGLLASQAVDAVGRTTAALESQHVRSLSDFVTLPAVAGFIESLERRSGLTQEDLERLAAGFATRVSTVLAAFSKQLLLGLFNDVFTFTATIFLVFFFLRDGESMGSALIDLVPIDAAGRAALTRSLRGMIGAIFRGSMLAALIQGMTGGIGWWIAGLGSPLLAGAAMSVLSLLPIGGTAIVWIPGSLWLWYSGGHGSAVFLFLWGLVVTSFLADNVLKPFLIGGTEELSTLVVFLGVFGGLAAFGLLGIFIGPVTLALAATLIDILRRQVVPHRVRASPP